MLALWCLIDTVRGRSTAMIKYQKSEAFSAALLGSVS